MTGDRLGVRWGLSGGIALRTIAQAREAASFAQTCGFDTLWISHGSAVQPMVALACVADAAPDVAELGTSVVPLYGRHPIDLAQLALTTQSACNGRFTLGIGAGSKAQAQDRHGLSWDRPYSFTCDFLDAMEPLLAGKPVHHEGEFLTARTELLVEAPTPPILLAALGPRMLRLAGARLQGTSLGQCGPRTIREYVVPHLAEGASRAGRTDTPRIVALVRVCVTDDLSGAKALAREISAFYQSFPSYRAVAAREGLAHPADLHLIGSEQQVLDGLARYAEAGATDLRVEVSAHDEPSRERTRQAVAAWLSRGAHTDGVAP